MRDMDELFDIFFPDNQQRRQLEKQHQWWETKLDFASMTRNKAGFIRCSEEKLGRPLQWVVCLLHCNELPLRHVFLELDGTTISPDSFLGPVGKKLNGKVSTSPVKNFEPIENANFYRKSSCPYYLKFSKSIQAGMENIALHFYWKHMSTKNVIACWETNVST